MSSLENFCTLWMSKKRLRAVFCSLISSRSSKQKIFFLLNGFLKDVRNAVCHWENWVSFSSFILQVNENIALRDKQPRREAIEMELRELETKQRQLEQEGVAMEKKLRENNEGSSSYSLIFCIVFTYFYYIYLFRWIFERKL